MLALRAVLFWILLFALAACNGALREFVLRPHLGETAKPLSGVTLALLIAAASYVFVRWNAPLTMLQAWLIGIGWLLLTVMAEAALMARAGRPAADVLTALSPRAIAAGDWVALAYLVVLLAPPLFVWMARR